MNENPVVVAHAEPAPPIRGDRTVMINLAGVGLDGQVEELWCEDLGGGLFRIASIPFCASGIALRDSIRLTGGAIELVGEGARRGVLRFLVDPNATEEKTHEIFKKVHVFLEKDSLRHEWHGDRFLAIDVPAGYEASAIVDALSGVDYVFWEWGVEPNS